MLLTDLMWVLPSMESTTCACMQTFATDPTMEAPGKIAEECKAKITGFQELLPLITAICNAGLHERHWEQIATVVGFDVRPDEVTSLRRLLDYNIQDHIKVTPHIVPHSQSAVGALSTCMWNAAAVCATTTMYSSDLMI